MDLTIEDQFKIGMRRLAGAVNLVTTGGGGVVRQGLTATAVCSLTIDPPTLLACVNKSASAHDAIADNGAFCVNVLAESQRDLANLFSDNDAIDQRFLEGSWLELETGAPVLDGCLCSFDCKVLERLERSTHTIFVGQVVAVAESENQPPLLYFDGQYATLPQQIKR